jgi:hypothetical protein
MKTCGGFDKNLYFFWISVIDQELIIIKIQKNLEETR